MESKLAARQLTLARRSVRYLFVVSLMLLAGGLMQNARAASDAFVDCDQLATSLRSLDVPPAELPLDSTDHLDADKQAALEAAADDKVSPVLLLTPRVATIMQEVFDSVAIDTGDTSEETSEPAPEAATPPVVKAISPPALPAADETATNPHYMPRFQRQMYRTDI